MSTTYLSRPVWDFSVNWAQTPRETFSYDLREHNLAFANPVLEPLQDATVRGFEFSIRLSDESEIVACDEFTAAAGGRLNGFWFPALFDTVEIVEGVSTTQFKVRNTGFADWFADEKCAHLVLTKPGALVCRQINSVTLGDDGLELVTLSTALDATPDSTWDVAKLLYCRFATEDQQAEFIADNVQSRTVRVVELPLEYTTIETGQAPVYLYEFTYTLGAYTALYRLTGLNEGITSQSQDFVSVPIQHGNHRKTTRQDREEMTIDSWLDLERNPISQFVPFKVPTSLWVTIYETTYAAPDTRTVIFTGKILEVEPEGKLLRAKAASWLDIAGRSCPKFKFQAVCNYAVYDANCTLSKASWQASGTIYGLNGRRVQVTLSNPPLSGNTASKATAFFSLGWVEAGSGETYEIRGIRQSAEYDTATGTMILRLDRPLEHAEVGDAIVLVPGCDGLGETCSQKFSNFRRWGGQVQAPQNATMEPLDTPTTSGKKA